MMMLNGLHRRLAAAMTVVAVLALFLVVSPPAAASAAGDPACAADVNDDGAVDILDLLAVLAAWGESGVPEDVNGDGLVDILDLLLVLAEWGPCATGEVYAIDLAGNALISYPYFQFVRAFNEGGTISFTIDPHTYPDVSGVVAAVYVVEPKTAAEWDDDPTLVDVRGGPQIVLLDGPDIPDNTFALTGALTGVNGTELGVGYDLVIDLNLDDELSGGDFIDGYGDEPGFYVVYDLAAPGPLAVTEVTYSVPFWSGTPGYAQENLFYPTLVGGMGELPLMVISHGNGHNYQWYNHIGNHLASYGYIVMSHANNTGPGIDTAAITTLQHTDEFLEKLNLIANGVLNGHVDTSRITWLGHSRGGEGVVRAYDRIVSGSWSPEQYELEDLVLVSSICPTYFSPGTSSADPHDVNYHLFYTGADSDVSGSPSSGSSKPFAILERAVGTKHLSYLHGAGHGDFHNGGGNPWAEGPDLIGSAATHKVLLGYLLALEKRYTEGNIPALDYLQRMYDDIHPAGIPVNVIVAKEYKDAEATGNFMIDGYETEPSTTTSSSGGLVVYNVSNIAEGRMIDVDGSFVFSAGVPFNGMTKARFAFDDSRCTVFDWTLGGARLYELEVIPEARDFTDDAFLSFRACQGTRHPETDALDAPLSFTVTLRDGSGTLSSIDFGNYGHITRTYKRTGWGSGAGWANEYSTVRIRLTDFTLNGSGLDLTDIVGVRFEFGTGLGSPRGRIGLDDIEVTLE